MKTQNKLFIAAFALIISSCKKQADVIQQPSATQLTASSSDEIFESAGAKNNLQISAKDFVNGIDNNYFPLKPGTIYYYLNALIEEGKLVKEHVTVTVTYDVKNILGVNCEVIHDQVKTDGEISEDTYDWYAQDKWGNVWYFGEDTKKYDNGIADSSGSFEAGKNGALPGIIMLAKPEKHLGRQYYQEYYPGFAIDQATALNVNSTASVKYGTFNNCLVTEEYTALEPDVLENKYYAPGVGQVLTVLNVGGDEREELLGISHY